MLAGCSGATSNGALVQGWVLLHRAGAAAEQKRAARSAHRVLFGQAGRPELGGERGKERRADARRPSGQRAYFIAGM
jgi:hypothetical protein